MARITERHLDAVVERINNTMGMPQTYRDDNGPCPGNYHLSYAYGGVALYQNVSTGGERDVFRSGHTTKSHLYDMMQAYLEGVTDANTR